MATSEWLAGQFQEHRAHLRTVAYRMLGSASEAEDAVQDTWIRLGRTDAGGIALLIVLDTLEPAERLAFVLHDVFGMTFDEISPIVDRSLLRHASSPDERAVEMSASWNDAPTVDSSP